MSIPLRCFSKQAVEKIIHWLDSTRIPLFKFGMIVTGEQVEIINGCGHCVTSKDVVDRLDEN